MRPLRDLEDLKKELEDKIKELEREVRQKLEEKEIQRIEKGPGLRKFPGSTREQHLLYFYTLRIEDIEKALKELRDIETKKIKEKVEYLKQKSGENIGQNSEKSNKFSKGVKSLERALKAIKGNEYQDFLEIKYETSDFYDNQPRNEFLSDERTEAVHTFLRISGLLGEKTPYREQLKNLRGIGSKDLKEADKYTRRIEDICEGLRERAETVDQSIKRASYSLKQAEE
jgi:hypothetical protein